MQYTGMNGGVMDVPLGSLERAIVRIALDRHKDELQKAVKKDKELGAPNKVAELHIAVIDGDSGWGEGLYGKMQEQAMLTAVDSNSSAEQGEARRIARDSEELERLLGELGHPIDRGTISTWTNDQRAETQTWAAAWLVRGRDDKDPTVLVPGTPAIVLAVLEEIARAEMELHEGILAALAASLVDVNAPVLIASVRSWTPEQRDEVRAWVEKAQAATTDDENAAVDDAIPEFLSDAMEAYEAAKQNAEALAAEQAEEQTEGQASDAQLDAVDAKLDEEEAGDEEEEWTAKPGELRLVATPEPTEG